MTPPQPVRTQILQQLNAAGPQNIDDLAAALPGLKRSQIIDNARLAANEKLAERNKDGTYKITSLGKQRIALGTCKQIRRQAVTPQAGSGDKTPAGAHRATAVGGSGHADIPPEGEPVATEPPTQDKTPAEAGSNVIQQPSYNPDAVSFDPRKRALAIAVRNHNLIAEICTVVGFPEDLPLEQLGTWIAEKISPQSTDMPTDMPTDKAYCNAAKIVATTAGKEVAELKQQIETLLAEREINRATISTLENLASALPAGAHPTRQTPANAALYPHYYRDVSHLTHIDIYRLLDLFEVTDSAASHAIKKLIAAGRRGAKDALTDLNEARDTIARRIEMLHEDTAKETDHDDETPPATLPLPASMTRCLAHDGRLGQTCQKADQCASNLTIRHPLEPFDHPDLKQQPPHKLCSDERYSSYLAVADGITQSRPA